MGIGGGGLAIAIVPRVEPLLSWRAPYVTAAGMAVVTLATVALAPSSRPAADAATATLRSLRSLGSPVLYRLAVIHAGSMAVGVITSSWAVPFLTRRGYGIVQAGTAASLILLGGIVSRPLGGWLARSRPGWTSGLVVCSLTTAATGMVLLVGPFGLSAPVPGCALLGLATGLPFGLVFNEAALARPDLPSMAVGFVNMFGNGAVVIGTPLLGLAFLAPNGVGFGFLTLAALGLLSGLALPGLDLPSRRDLRSPPL
jgi:cyanate permease